jgi:hypothetical protein
MDILFHVATEGGARYLTALARACHRRGCEFGVFLTHEGVRGLMDRELQSALEGVRAVACAKSWLRFCSETTCPVELGSQTTNSALIGKAKRVVSL